MACKCGHVESSHQAVEWVGSANNRKTWIVAAECRLCGGKKCPWYEEVKSVRSVRVGVRG